ncbi:MAG: M23 family metallopeptidase [Pseudomonadales bacterium]|nr:M23 family metallopeptidase [Pseudomonadales bacterium]
MKVIVINERHGQSKTIVLKGWLKGLLSVCLLGAPVALGYLGYHLALSQADQGYSQETAQSWQQQLREQADLLAQVKRDAEQQLEAMTMRLAMLQARLLRLDALGQRVTTVARLDNGEFDFSQDPGYGGPLLDEGDSFAQPDFLQAISQLEEQVADRAQQLEILEELMMNRQLDANSFLAGRPVNKGWISSGFGRRVDPFTGRLAWHSGVDFAGKAGDDVISVAAGVVTWSGDKQGYGLTVELNHGNGYTTRYAHADKLLVESGDIIRKGQTIALIGNTGRSTGPHVHFEVYKNGRIVDPSSYIHRTAR